MFQLSLYNLAVGGYTTSKETQQRGKPLNIPSQSYVSLLLLSLFARFTKEVGLFTSTLLLAWGRVTTSLYGPDTFQPE